MGEPGPAPAPAVTSGVDLIGMWITFGIVSIAAKSLGLLAPRVGLPLITGYLVVGAIAGPFVLGLIHKPDLQPLSLVTQFALAFISFSAGAELYLPELRSLFKRILYSTTMITVVTFTLSTALITALGSGGAGIVPFLEELPLGCRASVASIAASIMVARSPASAIAVVKELRAKGLFTSSILGITVLGDVFVLLLFTITTTLAESECKGEGLSGISLGITLAVIVVSVLVGWVVGHFLLLLMAVKRFPARFLILPLGLLIFVACHWFTDFSYANFGYVINLEPLLICITGGFVCSNRSNHRHRFLSVLQQSGPYVFLPFFTLTGASLDLRVMVQSFGFAAIIAALRAFCIFVGSSVGGRMAGVVPYTAPSNMMMWMCLLTQAGVSLGLASEVGMSFPEWGRSFQTAIIAIVLINQLIGPVLFKIAVRKMGEAGKATGADAHDEDAPVRNALVVGYTPEALAVAVRLLKERWAVTLVAGTEADAAAAKDALATYAQEARDAEARAASGDALAGVKAGVQSVLNVASGAAAQLTGAAATATTTTTTAAAAGAAPAHHDEHDHEKKRRLEELFATVALLPPGASADEDPLSRSAADAASSADAGAAGAGTDHRFAALAALVSTTRGLAAVVYACGSDAASLSACRIVDSILAAAPKKSSLHSVRQLVSLRSPAWTPAFEARGVIPLHAGLAASHVAVQLLAASRGKAVPLLPPAPSLDELCKGVSGSLVGSALFWRFSGAADADGEPPAAVRVEAETAAASGIRRGESSGARQRGGAGAAGSGGGLATFLAGEHVGEWDEARDEYLDSLHGLDENAQGGGDGGGEGSTSAGARRANLEEISMFGFLTRDGGEGEEEDGGGAGGGQGGDGEGVGKARGLAALDSAARADEWT
jgi:Kef-type K+ transport system membrane component KefB